jgi:branched-chain amino acid transport system ATP-binding protein
LRSTGGGLGVVDDLWVCLGAQQLGIRAAAHALVERVDRRDLSAVCSTTAVLDFGRLIALGPTADVLRDDTVRRAYLGTEEVLA